MNHFFTPALDGATNSCPFALIFCHQTCCELEEESRSPCSHITHPLVPIELLIEPSTDPYSLPARVLQQSSSMQHLHAQWEWLSTGALRESSSQGEQVCVCVATRPRRGQQTTKYTMSTGKNAPATEKWVVDGLMFILKVLHQCCALSCFCYSA